MGAVHIHLSVANFVEPCPGEEGISGRRVVGEGKSPRRRERARADPRVDNFPGLGLVVGQRNLTAAAFVCSRTGESKVVGASGLPGNGRFALGFVEVDVISFARIVASATQERAGHAIVFQGLRHVGVELGTKGVWPGQFHMSLS